MKGGKVVSLTVANGERRRSGTDGVLSQLPFGGPPEDEEPLGANMGKTAHAKKGQRGERYLNTREGREEC